MIQNTPSFYSFNQKRCNSTSNVGFGMKKVDAKLLELVSEAFTQNNYNVRLGKIIIPNYYENSFVKKHGIISASKTLTTSLRKYGWTTQLFNKEFTSPNLELIPVKNFEAIVPSKTQKVIIPAPNQIKVHEKPNSPEQLYENFELWRIITLKK